LFRFSHTESAGAPVALVLAHTKRSFIGLCPYGSQAKIHAVKLTGWKAPLWLAALLPEPLVLLESPDKSEFNPPPP